MNIHEMLGQLSLYTYANFRHKLCIMKWKENGRDMKLDCRNVDSNENLDLSNYDNLTFTRST